MSMQLQDGVYPAHLVASTVKLSSKGLPMIALQWKLDGSEITLKSYVHLTLADGSPNVKGIGLVKQWAPDWDGKDLYWFGEHLDKASTYQVKLTVANEPAWDDPSRTYANVKWVNPANWSLRRFVAASASPTPIAAEKTGEVPEVELEPTMTDTWRMWCAMTEKCSHTFRERTWLKYAAEVGGGKDQIDFTAEDWAKMQERLVG